MSESERRVRKSWLDYVKKNKTLLKFAIDNYDDAWYNVRQDMAEKGVELTPDELKNLVELIRESIGEIEDE